MLSWQIANKNRLGKDEVTKNLTTFLLQCHKSYSVQMLQRLFGYLH